MEGVLRTSPQVSTTEEHDLSSVPLGLDEPNLVWSCYRDGDPEAALIPHLPLGICLVGDSPEAARAIAVARQRPVREPRNMPLETALVRAREQFPGLPFYILNASLEVVEVF